MSENRNTAYLIGFDLGTSAMKAVLSDINGNVVCQASRQINILRPEKNQVELDPEFYFQDVCATIKELMSQVSDPSSVKALSLSGATGNTVLLDENYKPLRKVISWMDTRTVGKESDLCLGFDPERIYNCVGWPFDGTFPLAHLAWIKKFETDVWQKAKYFVMLNDYIYYRLCGRLVVDYSKATTFYMQDQVTAKWNEELLEFFELETRQLAELISPATSCGIVNSEAVSLTGLAEGTQLVTGSFDHPSAAISTGVTDEGDLLISAGTSWVVFAPIKNRETGLKGKMLIDPFLSPSGCWGAMFSLTAVAEKVKEYLEHCITPDIGETLYEGFNRLAAEAELGADGLFIEVYRQPYQKSKAMIKNVAQKNIARALMEGVVFLIRRRIDELLSLVGRPVDRIVLTGGPTKSHIWLSILADVLGRPVVLPETGQHAGAMGAAILAGIGAGVFRDEKDGYLKTKSRERIIEPDPVRSQLYHKIYLDYASQFY
ncbi:FGGY family carbohydrate kinase [Maribellus sp. YY47]|uniref:xylulokinase n=1 Tax=Maribellus sp. YY47 TaxID=2929486 RepID=UPI0020009D3E|nr:FGGY family carbohydrate kinase [Maribellus sp. YY47]MCK3684351.1 FGGY family carbohydrate kinase [Maribellus sp. YY47]